MKQYSFSTPPRELPTIWSLLVIPVIGTFIAAPLLNFIMSDRSIFSDVIMLILPWPQADFGKVITHILHYALAISPILLLCGGLIWLTNWVPLLCPIAQHVRSDWSLLSFLLYGTAPFLIILADEEYHGLWLYQFASLAILGGGALAYLYPASSWSRLLKLLIALGLSMGLLGVGIYLLYPQQAWAAHTSFPRWWEAINPLLQGVSLAMNLAAPAILQWLPARSQKRPFNVPAPGP